MSPQQHRRERYLSKNPLTRPLPLEPGLQLLALPVGVDAGVAPPAFAERVGPWAAAHTHRRVLAMGAGDHEVPGACPALRTGLTSLRAGMVAPRPLAPVAPVVPGRAQARASTGR